MYENCPEKCRCRIDNMNVPLWVEVSCSEANMSALPEILPPNTLKLNVSHNQVSTLKLVVPKAKVRKFQNEYRARAIITSGLYTFYPLFEVQKRFSRGFFPQNSCLALSIYG